MTDLPLPPQLPEARLHWAVGVIRAFRPGGPMAGALGAAGLVSEGQRHLAALKISNPELFRQPPPRRPHNPAHP